MTDTRRMPARAEASPLLAPIADLASEAGARILEIAEKGFAARTKADQSPVTAADEAAEAILTEGLARLLPDVPVIAEESVSRHEPAHPPAAYFLVDPVDGTREFIAGRSEYTVNVALIENHQPVLGVIYAPALHLLYAGCGGRALRAEVEPGDRFDPARVAEIRARPRPERLVALLSRTHPDAKSDEFLTRLPVDRTERLGSSLKFARIAEGVADVYARLATVNEWDIGAGHALLAAAGGSVTAPDGGMIAYGTRERGFRIDGFVAWGAPPE